LWHSTVSNRLIVASVAITLLVIAVIAYTALVHRSTPTPPPTRAESATTAGAVGMAAPTGPVAELAPLTPDTDPKTFARQAAEAIFTWNTSALVGRANHLARLVAVADPTGESTAGLVSDLDNYLPAQDAWVDLMRYETRQWLAIDSVTTPTAWADAVAQARDDLLPGTTALTIRGTRHRSGIWEGVPVRSEHDVAFTVFIVCGPSYPECHLLRLSRLDQPLE
jgi:hypothetical protein